MATVIITLPSSSLRLQWSTTATARQFRGTSTVTRSIIGTGITMAIVMCITTPDTETDTGCRCCDMDSTDTMKPRAIGARADIATK